MGDSREKGGGGNEIHAPSACGLAVKSQAMENTYSKNSSVIHQKFPIYRSCIKSFISILKYN